MKYRLVSLGQLKKDVNEAEALQQLQKITKLSEAALKKKLLSGTKVGLMTSDNVEKLAALKSKLTTAGLLVEVVEIAEANDNLEQGDSATKKPVNDNKPKNPKAAKPRRRNKFKRSLRLLILLLVIGTVSVAALWYWFFIGQPNQGARIERALVSSDTSAIAQVNVEQISQLANIAGYSLIDIIGQPDKATLTSDVLSRLSLNKSFIKQLYLVAFNDTEQQKTAAAFVLVGEFAAQEWTPLLAKYYDLSQTDGLTRLQPKAPVVEFACPSDDIVSGSASYAKIVNNRLMVASEPSTLLALEKAIAVVKPESENFNRWQKFKRFKISSAMVFSPEESVTAVPGLFGHLMQSMVKTVPNIKGAAVSAHIDIVTQRLVFDGELASLDPSWNTAKSTEASAWLKTTISDTSITSKNMAKLLSNLSVAADSDSVDVKWSIGKGELRSLKHSIESSIASIFAGGWSVDNDTAVKLISKPTDWSLPLNLSALPAYVKPEYQAAPLFIHGPFSADVQSLRMTDEQNLELTIETKAALPEIEDANSLREILRFSLSVTDVVNNQGEPLIRDERCITNTSFFGEKNHEPNTYGSAFMTEASTTKKIRLIENTNVSDIDKITGSYILRRPENVQRLSLPLLAGETASFAGLTFEVISVGEHSVRYMASGAVEKLMEVRGYTSENEVIQQSWSTSFGSNKDQNFSGPLAALDIFVAESFQQIEFPFMLENIFARSGEEDDAVSPFALSYSAVQRAKWNQYQLADMRLLKVDKKDWTFGDDLGKEVGQKTWPAIKLFVTESASKWNSNPEAHLYLPLWQELVASMSSLSYIIEGANNDQEQFIGVNFPYIVQTRQLVETAKLRDLSFGLMNISLDANYESDQAFSGIKGKFLFRLPQQLAEQDITLNSLWQGQAINGLNVQLMSVERGNIPGYRLKITGTLDKLISVHGVTDFRQKVAASSKNFQRDSSWIVTIPFRDALNKIRVITALEQDLFELAFKF